MLSRTSTRLLLESQWPAHLPPSFLLPVQTRSWLSSVSHHTAPDSVPEPLISSARHQPSHTSAPTTLRQMPPADQTPAIPHAVAPSTQPAPPALTTSRRKAPASPKHHDSPLRLSKNLRSMLPLLRAQRSHYAAMHVHGKSYLVTEGDTIRFPFLMPDVSPGDTLRLDCAALIGSRDFTLRPGLLAHQAGNGAAEGAPINNHAENPSMTKAQAYRLDGKRRVKSAYLDDRLFVCRAVVTAVDSEPMRVVEKKKQRNRHARHVFSKHRYTCVRISELRVKSVDELRAEEGRGRGAGTGTETEVEAVVELKGAQAQAQAVV
ncbi:MAG: bL21 family ribosomal protein [Terriglobus roseus]|nr:bL21 family ribosomal protein [Terriglobus roseus]